MNIAEARKKMRMSRREVSDWLEIPYRTMCGWENGERVCPTYVEKLIVEKILRGSNKEQKSGTLENVKRQIENAYTDLKGCELYKEEKYFRNGIDFMHDNTMDIINSELSGEKENANMKVLGTLWNDKEIEIVEIEGRPIALYGWNGETYLNCWEVKEMINGTGFDIKEDGLRVRPLYKQIDEDDFEVVGYELL